MKMIGARALIECLKKEQVQVVFGYPGGSVLTLYNELDQSDITHVLTGHEQVMNRELSMRQTATPGQRDIPELPLPPPDQVSAIW